MEGEGRKAEKRRMENWKEREGGGNEMRKEEDGERKKDGGRGSGRGWRDERQGGRGK